MTVVESSSAFSFANVSSQNESVFCIVNGLSVLLGIVLLLRDASIHSFY